MFKKYLSFGLIGVLLFTASFQAVSAKALPADSTEKIKADVRKFGSGDTPKIVVKMKNGAKVEGHIRQILDESFDVTNSKTKQTTTIVYGDVLSVKKQGWSSGAKIALGIGIGAAVTVAVIAGIVGAKGLDGFCPLGSC